MQMHRISDGFSQKTPRAPNLFPPATIRSDVRFGLGCSPVLIEQPLRVRMLSILIDRRLHFFRELRSTNSGESIEEASEAHSRYSTLALAPSDLQSFFKFSESDERHSCFNSFAKGTAHLPAMWIGIADRTQSLSELFACSGSGRSSPSTSVGRDA